MSTRPFSLAVFLAVSAAALSLPPSAVLAVEAERPLGERVREGASATGERVREGASAAGERVREGASAVGDYAGDALITTKVKTAMVANDTVKALDVGVETRDGVVHLTGAVDTPEQSATAERLAREVKDVRSVVNRLTLKNSNR